MLVLVTLVTQNPCCWSPKGLVSALLLLGISSPLRGSYPSKTHTLLTYHATGKTVGTLCVGVDPLCVAAGHPARPWDTLRVRVGLSDRHRVACSGIRRLPSRCEALLGSVVGHLWTLSQSPRHSSVRHGTLCQTSARPPGSKTLSSTVWDSQGGRWISA